MIKDLDKEKLKERYFILDMMIFTISVTIILLLIVNFIRVYSDTEAIATELLFKRLNQIESRILFKMNSNIVKMELYESEISQILKKHKKSTGILDIQSLTYDIKELGNKKLDFLILNNPYIKKYNSHIDDNFKPNLNKKTLYSKVYNNKIILCKNIIINNRTIGTITSDPLSILFNRFQKSNDIYEVYSNIVELIIIKGDKEITILDNYNKKNNIVRTNQIDIEGTNESASVNIFNGNNFIFKKMHDYDISIKFRLENEYIRNKIYKGFITKFLEIFVFSFFSFILIFLIIKKDKLRNKYAEQLKENALYANKAKSDFLEYTAHEIRSPLGFILTGTEMIKANLFGPISDKCRQYIEGINSNAQSILTFITEILDESRILQNKFSLERDYYDIKSIVNDVVHHNKTKFYSKTISFINEFQEEIPKLYCDTKKMYQIINNLITNSCKYSRDETIIKIRIIVNKENLLIKIEDNGIGMNESEIKILINKYESINLNKTPDSYGLGLSIVRLLVEAHEANFYLSSEKNIGTCATIIFDSNFLKY